VLSLFAFFKIVMQSKNCAQTAPCSQTLWENISI